MFVAVAGTTTPRSQLRPTSASGENLRQGPRRSPATTRSRRNLWSTSSARRKPKIHIAVGKLAVYTAAGGIDPARTIPVMLDVGTDRQSLLDDPLYVGNRHPRVPAAEYDAFLDEFVRVVGKLFPLALLH